MCYSGGMVKKATKTTKTKKPAASAAKTKKAPKAAVKEQKVVAEKVTAKKPAKKLSAASLYAWNKWLALLYAAQGVAIIVIGVAYSLPVTTSFLTKDTFTSKAGETPVLAPALQHLFDINLVYLVASFLFVAAITHILFATAYRNRYEKEISVGINRGRWAGFGVTGALMLVTISLISGVQDVSLLLVLVGTAIIASLSGLAIEVYSKGTPRRRLAYVIAWIASVLPWLVIGIYLLGANIYGSGNIPAYVYGIVASIFILFIAFALNVYFQYKGRGKWADYLYSERTNNILIFVAASALAWQVFAGVLLP